MGMIPFAGYFELSVRARAPELVAMFSGSNALRNEAGRPSALNLSSSLEVDATFLVELR